MIFEEKNQKPKNHQFAGDWKKNRRIEASFPLGSFKAINSLFMATPPLLSGNGIATRERMACYS
jgi:hypothetical protein